MACDKTGIDIMTEIDGKLSAVMAKKSTSLGVQDLLLGEVYNMKREVVNSGLTGDDLSDEVASSAGDLVSQGETAVDSTDGLMECADTIDGFCKGAAEKIFEVAGSVQDAIELANHAISLVSNSSLAGVLNDLASVASKYISKLDGSGIIDDLLSLDGLFTCADGYPDIDRDALQERMDKITELEEDLWVSSEDGVDKSLIDKMTIEAGNFGSDVEEALTSSFTEARESAADVAEKMNAKIEEDVAKTKEAISEVKRPDKKLF